MSTTPTRLCYLRPSVTETNTHCSEADGQLQLRKCTSPWRAGVFEMIPLFPSTCHPPEQECGARPLPESGRCGFPGPPGLPGALLAAPLASAPPAQAKDSSTNTTSAFCNIRVSSACWQRRDRRGYAASLGGTSIDLLPCSRFRISVQRARASPPLPFLRRSPLRRPLSSAVPPPARSRGWAPSSAPDLRPRSQPL